MAPTKIMLIRHAEKPDEKTNVIGVDEAGTPNPHQLSVRGWQRAGALVRFFAPAGHACAKNIETPSAIFAARPTNGANSLRPLNTVAPLAAALGIAVNDDFGRGEEAALIEMVKSVGGAVLICWGQDPMANIVRQIAGNFETHPQAWPKRRFDLVWVLDRGDNGWKFSQAAQLVLPGDIPLSYAKALDTIAPCRTQQHFYPLTATIGSERIAMQQQFAPLL